MEKKHESGGYTDNKSEPENDYSPTISDIIEGKIELSSQILKLISKFEARNHGVIISIINLERKDLSIMNVMLKEKIVNVKLKLKLIV